MHKCHRPVRVSFIVHAVMYTVPNRSAFRHFQMPRFCARTFLSVVKDNWKRIAPFIRIRKKPPRSSPTAALSKLLRTPWIALNKNDAPRRQKHSPPRGIDVLSTKVRTSIHTFKLFSLVIQTVSRFAFSIFHSTGESMLPPEITTPVFRPRDFIFPERRAATPTAPAPSTIR